MKILVTRGAGFLGAHLSEKLLGLDECLTVLIIMMQFSF